MKKFSYIRILAIVTAIIILFFMCFFLYTLKDYTFDKNFIKSVVIGEGMLAIYLGQSIMTFFIHKNFLPDTAIPRGVRISATLLSIGCWFNIVCTLLLFIQLIVTSKNFTANVAGLIAISFF